MLPFSNPPLAPESDFDRLFAAGGRGDAVAGVQGHVFDAEPDLGLGQGFPAVGRPPHSGNRLRSNLRDSAAGLTSA